MYAKWAGLLSGLLLFGSVAAGTSASAAEARPNADEECVMQCDEQADKCMSQAGGDEEKAKACDDRYTQCLKECR